MPNEPGVVDVMEWGIPEWSPMIVIPSRWLDETTPPTERGPFFVIHCGDRDTALHVCELMNEEAERVLRNVVIDGSAPDAL